MRKPPAIAAVAATLILLAVAPAARANGRLPSVISLAARDDVPDYLMMSATFGLVVSSDGAASWGWACEQSIGYMGTYDPIFVRGVGGTLLATTFTGIVRSTDGACTWVAATGTDDEDMRAMIAHPSIAGTYFATSGNNSVDTFNALYTSTDDGATWTPHAILQSMAQWYDGVAVSPSDPTRMYVASWYFAPREAFIHRSDDGGGIFTSNPYPIVDPERIRLLGVSVSDPDVVLWLRDGMAGDAIVRSDDGGATAIDALPLTAALAAFTVAGDGTMYAATLASELLSSTDDGLSWSPVASGTPAVNCLKEVAGRLYGCTNPFATGYSVSYSDDGGVTWAGLYQFCDTDGPLSSCPIGTPTRDVCEPLWPQLRAMLKATCNVMTTDAGPASDGASARDDTPPKHRCGCAVPGRAGAPEPAVAVLLAALAGIVTTLRRR